MVRMTSLLAIAILALGGCSRKDSPGAKDQPVQTGDVAITDVDEDDAAMNQAIADARAHVEVFAEQLAAPRPGQTFSVKKPFPWGTSGAEHMWLIDVKLVDGGFEGRLDNAPRDARDARRGERYQVARAELSDWLIADVEGRLWGAYTLRALLHTMPPAERAQFEQALQPLPAVRSPDEDGETARAPGRRAVGELKQRLVVALTEAMGRGVPEAIAVCSTEAPAIAAALAGDRMTVGRATGKPRNPGNAAAGWQAEALAHFEALVAAGTPLDGAFVSRRLPDGRDAYAEPLLIQPMCLACHGATLTPEVTAALAARYPDDQATGYATGDLRGVVWAAW